MIEDKIKNITIRENSWVARIAAKRLRCQSVAIVLGSTIYLYNATRQDLLQNKRWLKHELCHIKQFKEHGFVRFILKYVRESVKNGYYNNKFEIEARKAEEG